MAKIANGYQFSLAVGVNDLPFSLVRHPDVPLTTLVRVFQIFVAGFARIQLPLVVVKTPSSSPGA